MGLHDGHRVCGFDFGRRHNQIVGCRIVVDSMHTDGYRILDWIAIDFGDKSLVEVVSILARRESPLFDSDWYVLEKQVPQTGRLAVNVFCYALSHALQCKLVQKAEPGRVLFVDAKSKFVQLDPEGKHRPGPPERKPNYSRRKRWAVELCRFHTESQDRAACTLFNTWKKRDDLADAFLYAYAFFDEYRTRQY